MRITTKLIRDKLRKNMIDPELGINVVDLGLIYKIQVTRVKSQESRSGHPSSIIHHPSINILMTLTTTGCPLAAVFLPMIRQTLSDIPGFNPYNDLRVDITFDPPWHPGLMSPGAKAEMGL